MSKVIENEAQTINSFSMKSSRVSAKIVQKCLALSGSLWLFPKCSVLSMKSTPVSPVSKLTLSLSRMF